MKKTYTKFNLLSLLVIIIIVASLPLFLSYNSNTVKFKDKSLEQAIRDTINKQSGDILVNEVDTLEILDARGYGIKYLDGIENLHNLHELYLEDNFIKDVSPLKNNMRLRILDLRNNEITSLEEINFESIMYLHLRDLNLRHNVIKDEKGRSTRLKDINLLSKFISLRHLDLSDNHIEDLSPLSNLRRLTKLDLRENKISNIEAISTLTRLEELNLRDNYISSLEAISYLHQLKYLNIHSNENIESVAPIENLHNLETLIMRNVKVDNNKFLENKLKLQKLNAANTGLVDLDNKAIVEDLMKNGSLTEDVSPIKLLNTLNDPVVDKETGFYKDTIKVYVDSKYDTYYTLDGSEPTIKSSKYKSGITINQSDNNSATVLRLRSFDRNLSSNIISKTYFVNEAIDERFTLPIFSIITGEDNLFNEDIGIYHENNYEYKGSEWERPAHLEFINEKGSLEYSHNIGLRLNGDWTRTLPQKSLRLIFSSRLGDEGLADYDFFNINKSHKYDTLILRNSGNDWGYTMFADAMMQNLVKDINDFSTQDYLASVVFINGEYYGIHNLRERYDAQYYKNHYEIDKDALIVLKNNSEISIGELDAKIEYDGFIDYLDTTELNNEKAYEYIGSQIDLDSFYTYYSAEIYFGNLDWPQNNIRYWKKTTKLNDTFGNDGKWRFSMYDTDFGFDYQWNESWGNTETEVLDVSTNSIKWLMSENNLRTEDRWPNILFRSLMENDKIKNEFIIRFTDLINTNFDTNRIHQIITSMQDNISLEMDYHINRWRDADTYYDKITSKEVWKANIQNKIDFATNRSEYILNHLKNEFNLDDLDKFNWINE